MAGDEKFYERNCIELDGVTNPEIILGTAEELGLSGSSFTVDCWIYLPGDFRKYILDILEGNEKWYFFSTILGGDKTEARRNQNLCFGLEPDGKATIGMHDNDIRGDYKMALDKWHHLIFSAELLEGETGMSQYRIYTDGGHEKSGENNTYAGNEKLQLGKRTVHNVFLFKGKIGPIRFWNFPITTKAEAAQLMEVELGSKLEGKSPIFSWSNTDGLKKYQIEPPKYQFELDGKTNPRILLGKANELGLSGSAFTIDCWAYFDYEKKAAGSPEAVNICPIIGEKYKETDDHNINVSFGINPQGKAIIRMHRNDVFGNTVLQPKKWYHLIFSAKLIGGINHNSKYRIFLDGTQDVESEKKPPDIRQEFLLGGGSSKVFKGKIGPVRFWDFPITTEADAKILMATEVGFPVKGNSPTFSWLQTTKDKIETASKPKLEDSWQKHTLQLDDSSPEGIMLGTMEELGLMENATLEFQLNADRVSSGYDVILQSSSDVGLVMGLESGMPNLGKDYMSPGISLLEKDRVRRNQWYHVIIQLEKDQTHQKDIKCNITVGDDSKEIYLDIRNEDVLYLGRSKERNFFTGKIRGLRIWKEKKEKAFLEKMKSTYLFSGPDLIAYWSIDSRGNLHKNTIVNPQLLGYKASEPHTIKEVGKIGLEAFINQTQQTVNQARTQGKDKSYQIGRVTMDVKVFPEYDGEAISFPDADQVADYPLSSLKLEFTPEMDKQARPARSYQVPDVQSYTQVHAARKLNQAGFSYEIKYQLTSDTSSIDRVVAQQPEAKTAFDHQPLVTLFIGKAVLPTTQDEQSR